LAGKEIHPHQFKLKVKEFIQKYKDSIIHLQRISRNKYFQDDYICLPFSFKSAIFLLSKVKVRKSEAYSKKGPTGYIGFSSVFPRLFYHDPFFIKHINTAKYVSIVKELKHRAVKT
jgi:hypothetical protein